MAKPYLRKFVDGDQGEFVCPAFSKCGYSTNLKRSLTRHMDNCEHVPQSSFSTTQAPDFRTSKRVRSEETTLVGAYPITRGELVNFKAEEVRGAPWTALGLGLGKRF